MVVDPNCWHVCIGPHSVCVGERWAMDITDSLSSSHFLLIFHSIAHLLCLSHRLTHFHALSICLSHPFFPPLFSHSLPHTFWLLTFSTISHNRSRLHKSSHQPSDSEAVGFTAWEATTNLLPTCLWYATVHELSCGGWQWMETKWSFHQQNRYYGKSHGMHFKRMSTDFSADRDRADMVVYSMKEQKQQSNRGSLISQKYVMTNNALCGAATEWIKTMSHHQ